MSARPSPEKPSRRFWFSCAALVRTRKAYRAGAEAGVAAVGAGAVDLTTTGYFAHAARPTSEAISASTSVVDFRCEYMKGPPIAGVVRRLSHVSPSGNAVGRSSEMQDECQRETMKRQGLRSLVAPPTGPPGVILARR